MPIIHFINNKTQTAGGMRNVLNYVSRKEKTVSEDKRFVTGVNCSPETALDEMTATKNLYHKSDGRLYYHLVQSFPSRYEIEPELAHKIAVELAEKAFNKYEVIVATHIDREHIHSHFVFNSVSFEDGKKYHSNKETVEELMKLSDEICQRYGVHVLDAPKKKMNIDYLSDREYRSAKKGESFKWELMNVINQVMKQAKSKKQFCYLMKQQGYDVRWEDNRKYITYTCPNGRRCRDNKIHGDKYRKENMEYEFETRRIAADVRQGIVGCGGNSASSVGTRCQLESTDRIEQADVAGAAGNTQPTLGAGDESGYRTGAENSTLRAESNHRNLSGTAESGSGTVGNSGGSTGESNSKLVITGWEAERGIWLEAERARRVQVQAQLESSQVDSDITVGIDSIIGSVTAVASIIEDEPVDDTEYAREHIDSKALAEERERKEAHGIHMG
ncbi:relaxase/mobilization nuclease domain-containing protein [Ruminococcus flavefaciens]|uniref:Relaxase/mobilization nuclease-like protein n=1 Tax=Ruminococcus flavefaciens TaxID=1265 RepID=A0A315XU01_RUMFL|nr:relaxase/mobilization nuclease domain-containing protein [Ruminococcus flavefaciens]PWJ09796.1 relaxase/mobilization nuclease-like protein [Ruminococcus flavefaciens]SSA52198.1 Relaxase/Mobilisation nuclease domain-containing protein [Ruminococcus flavefaciens]